MITLRQYAAKETIITEHENGETAFIIESGKVEVTKERAGGTAHIAFLEKGAAFGEMSMVDDMPRSATVTALEPTLVRVIHRNDVCSIMREDPDAIIKLLKNIFERLREANAAIAQGRPGDKPAGATGAAASGRVAAPAAPPEKPARYTIEAMTPEAAEAIPSNPLVFTALPFKIGRKSEDPLVQNHLEIIDQDPLQISRHHVSIVRDGGRIGVVDRGSQLGALVDGVRIGGKRNGPGPAFFKGAEGILILGTDSSPFRYKVGIVS